LQFDLKLYTILQGWGDSTYGCTHATLTQLNIDE